MTTTETTTITREQFEDANAKIEMQIAALEQASWSVGVAFDTLGEVNAIVGEKIYRRRGALEDTKAGLAAINSLITGLRSQQRALAELPIIEGE
jgi:hypothetical protein